MIGDGMQWACGLSLRLLSARSLATATALVRKSGLPGSTVEGDHQVPDKSGFPFAIRGAAPDGGLCRDAFAAAARRSSPSVLSCEVSSMWMSSGTAFADSTAMPLRLKAESPPTATVMSYLPAGRSPLA